MFGHHDKLFSSCIHYQIKDKMRTILAIVVISCFFAVAMSQSADCANRASDLSNCISRLATAASQGQVTEFCNECGNTLYSYYEDCLGGADPVRAGIIESKRYYYSHACSCYLRLVA